MKLYMAIAVIFASTITGSTNASPESYGADGEFESRGVDAEVAKLRDMMRNAESMEEREEIRKRMADIRMERKKNRRREDRKSRKNGRKRAHGDRDRGDTDFGFDRKLEREKLKNMTPEERRAYKRARREKSRAREF
mmetsp:Transcript_29186/g.42826  ORF Transcript_29186/g.42826 Transcript_29186/m.42826 type:complete len:137 (-) Transcript_29186:179-589(-)|eukprot:CAMPEP_0116020162 /NCGR_PEP_ID=MMETSP0321-20121206/9643_1 /TAXON_ID=163516 /ORGANISM="Leptocylindrus danicus var. danicus, Strain B650" /LENGTH=136 /DNA_ID=CAMNT_0003490821 /DNA_START=64 /DNA_END=474 /DNA_ORIENTATION=-